MNGEQVSCHQLALALDRFSDALMGNLRQFTEIEDSSGVGTIWTCCITCLGHLAALCHLICCTVPVLRGSMSDLCDLTLDRLAGLSHEMHVEECSHFDVLTGVCIIVVLPIRVRN